MKKKLGLVLAAAAILGTGITIGTKLAVRAPKSEGTITPAKKDLYRCPMHPSVTSDHPDRCPICHMDLQKVEDDERSALIPAAKPTGPGGPSPGDAAVTSHSGFSLSLQKQQMIGVVITHAEIKPLSSSIRATGTVAFDPDLYTAVEEYRQALVTRKEMSDGAYDALKKQADELVASARTKLRIMGLDDKQIRALTGRKNSMSLLLPQGSVWINADVYEYEVAGITTGNPIIVTSPSVPGQTFNGKIWSISPIVNSPTRTIRVRAEVPDPKGQLRPDTFVNVRFQIDHGRRLAVPEDAVLHSGGQDFVFVVKGQGRFEPRLVSLGFKTADQYEITSGLSDGEPVVSAANFLIDSESRLRSALQNMGSTSNENKAAAPGKGKQP